MSFKHKIEQVATMLETLKKSLRSNSELEKSDEQVIYSENGQWTLEKAIKPGPALNYGSFNSIDSSASEANARTQDYATHETQSQIDARNAVKAKKEKQRKLDLAAKIRNRNSAVDTMKDRGQIKTIKD